MNTLAPTILLINPPHTAIGSRIPDDHLPPLGLLSIGGPLIDAGYSVRLLDADYANLPLTQIVDHAIEVQPHFILVGHAGSSSAHPTVAALAALLKHKLPDTPLIYGGVFPTYHWFDILQGHQAIDYIVRGEGEATTLALVDALAHAHGVEHVRGIAYRANGHPQITPPAHILTNLDAYRIGWELVDLSRYRYWGGKRAVVVQFSRGCPYPCSYCGQRGFWSRHRYRDPVQFARMLAWLHRAHDVEVVNFADELPTGNRRIWQRFLEALIAENVPLQLVASTRTSDIVRDADILPLYKKAGVIRFLLGIETYNAQVQKQIQKHASVDQDRQAIELLRQHHILSMATYVIGFSEEKDRDFWDTLRHLQSYDPDQIQLLYATPHRWVPFYQTIEHQQVVQTDTRKWDYKHQVLDNPHVPPWRIFLWSKFIEIALQLRPKALQRTFFPKTPELGHGMRWYTAVGRRVWLHECWDFIRNPPRRTGQTLNIFYGASLAENEYAMVRQPPTRR